MSSYTIQAKKLFGINKVFLFSFSGHTQVKASSVDLGRLDHCIKRLQAAVLNNTVQLYATGPHVERKGENKRNVLVLKY